MSLDAFLKRYQDAADIESTQKDQIFEELEELFNSKNFATWNSTNEAIVFKHRSLPISLKFSFSKRIDFFLDLEINQEHRGSVRFKKGNDGLSMFVAQHECAEASAASLKDAVNFLFVGH